MSTGRKVIVEFTQAEATALVTPLTAVNKSTPIAEYCKAHDRGIEKIRHQLNAVQGRNRLGPR